MKTMRLDEPRPRPMLVAALVAIAIGIMALTRVAGKESHPQERERTFRAINNIVLVHGAWADGSSWAKVIPMLSARGMHVVAVQNHLRSFAEDVDTTKRAIAAQNGPVLLVGHSYGGAVITQAGDDPKVAGLVYVAAFAPEVGESPFELLKAYPSPITSELQPDQGGFIRLSPDAVRADFAQDLSDAEQNLLSVTQGPTTVAASSTKITSAAWKVKPCWYLLAQNDRALSPDLQQLFATRMKATTLTLLTSHVPMLSRPQDVAAFIRSAAGQPD
jgi:pimeloyl-ACP methyl ester carboxylesterase